MPSPTPAQLATELNTDPLTLGYAALIAAGRDADLAAALNLARAGAGYQIYRGPIGAYEVINATVPAEWAALTADEKNRYAVLTGAGDVDTSNANVRSAFAAMFANGTATRTALNAMAVRQGSRAEVLWGIGTAITPTEISFALRGAR